MRLFSFIAVICASMLLGACTKQELPQLSYPQPITVPSASGALGPRLARGSNDVLILSWMERGDSGATLRYSTLFEGHWQSPGTAATDPAMFVNWADLPAVTPTRSDTLLAHWLSYVADAPYAYQILTSQSKDGGESWSEPFSPHDDGTDTEHGFVSVFPDDLGTGLVWLDGRNGENGMTLRSGILAGESDMQNEALVDDLICDCCQTSVAMAESGPIAVYRDRTSEEVRDIFVARRVDDIWQPGVAVGNDGWVIDGCPVNGPSVSAAEKLVVVGWFTGAGGRAVVKTAVSRNSGKTFSEPVEVAAENVLGRVSVEIVDRSSYVISWLESHDGAYAIKVRSMTANGQLGRIHTAGRSNVARMVPQLKRVSDKLIIAWTDKRNDTSKVVSVEMPILGLYE